MLEPNGTYLDPVDIVFVPVDGSLPIKTIKSVFTAPVFLHWGQ